MAFSIIVLILVLFLISVRQVRWISLAIWRIMLAGAFIVLVWGAITPEDALKSIDVDIMVYIFCMFIIGQSLEESGYLSRLSIGFFSKARSVDRLVLLILFGSGLGSAFLMNDTLAIIGTPVVLFYSRRLDIPPKLLLFSLAFGITTGSALSPIGNPQNLLIALGSKLPNPFITFFRPLLIPTIINLLLCYVLLKAFF